MLEELWGELPLAQRAKTGLSAPEREALCKIPQVALLEGPKLFQPEIDTTRVKQEDNTRDSLVTKNIELLRYKRQMTKILETLVLHRSNTAGEGEVLPPVGQPPPMPQVNPFDRTAKTTLFGFPLKEEADLKPVVVPEISQKDAELGLRKAVIKLSAHIGYTSAMDSAVRVLSEAAELYLQNLLRTMRCELDRDLENNGEGNGWTDVLEKALVESGVGGILGVQEHYEDSVIKFHQRLNMQCRDLLEKYKSEVPSEVGGWEGNHDNIPEMHFPSSDEGAGLGDTLPNHATPTLDVGMQMLQSLEANGELDTPLSGDSEALSNMSCPTPSPALTPRTAAPSPQLGSSKKRRRSGGKFI